MTIVESIISRETPAEIIYEDDLIIAFMDIRPINKGHILICPKNPYPDFISVPEDVLLSISRVAKNIYVKLTEKYKPDGISFLQNNGNQNEIIWLTDFLGYQMEALDSLMFQVDKCPLYTSEMASTYQQHIESFDYDGDVEIPNDVNSDITVIENVKLPTEKMYLAYYKNNIEHIESFLAAKSIINNCYPIHSNI